MEDFLILYTTWPDAETVETVAAEAVAERLAACVNILAPMRSVYRWEGAIERAIEIPAIFKTTAKCAEALREFLLARHPYSTPAMIAMRLDPTGSSPQFLSWIAAEVSEPKVNPSGDVERL